MMISNDRCKDGPQHGGQECHYWSELSQRVQIPRWSMNISNKDDSFPFFHNVTNELEMCKSL